MSGSIGPGGKGYSEAFYGAIAGGSGRSAEIVLPPVFGICTPTSVVDVGCGVGAWLRVARSLGARDVLGIDGDHVPLGMLEVAADEFRAADLARPLPHLGRRFDLALSLEVAEHLPVERSDGFVGDLCALSDVVLFSAAIPHQGGQDHVNEQWPSEWANRFARMGYQAFDVVRPIVWSNSEVEYWYRQNAVLYVAASRPDLIGLAVAARSAAGELLDVVHPVTYERVHRKGPFHPGLRYSLLLTARAARTAAAARMDRIRHR